MSPGGPPALTPFDLFTVNILPGAQGPGVVEMLDQQRAQIQSLLDSVSPGNNGSFSVTADNAALLTELGVVTTRELGARLLALSDSLTAEIAGNSEVRAYFDAPRVYMNSQRIVPSTAGNTTAVAGIDLLADRIRGVVAPGQRADAGFTFQVSRGMTESAVEGVVVAAPGQTTGVSASAIFAAANAQQIPIVFLAAGSENELASLSLSAEAKARITSALAAGQIVAVPATAVQLNGARRSAGSNSTRSREPRSGCWRMAVTGALRSTRGC